MLLGLTTADAADAGELFFAAGEGDGVRTISVGGPLLNWREGQFGDRWSYDLAGEWQLARWLADDEPGGVETLLDGSVTAVLTLRPTVWPASYVEGGFGLHFLSEDQIGADRNLGWRFQFGEFLGAGVHLGAKHRYAVGLRIQHESNGSTKAENDGVTFVQGIVRCTF